MSSFSWLDHSERDRRRMLDVVSLFSEKDTRDELGVGVIRDGFADMLSPGTSTVQRRARYFLFVPWMYRELERLRVPSHKVADRARSFEIRLIDALADSDDNEGVIGIQARSSLKRLPSNIYWQGLGALGIRLFRGSQAHYHRSLDVFYRFKGSEIRNDDNDLVHGNARRNWHPSIPSMPEGPPNEVSLALEPAEATFLRERILSCAPMSLLAFLVDSGGPQTEASFPWAHPLLGEMPQPLRERLSHAQFFSETFHGAPLLYNLMLAESSKNDERVEHFERRLDNWSDVVESRLAKYRSWDRRLFWDLLARVGARPGTPTKAFVERWLDLSLSDKGASTIADNQNARRLVHARERVLKGGLARLENRRALDTWGGSSGADRLTYRWGITQRIASDIVEGERRGEDA